VARIGFTRHFAAGYRKKIIGRILLSLVALQALAAPVWAVLPNEVLKDPALEARARVLSQGLRCVVCQNQSIDDSNAPLARDLRILLRERLIASDSDDQAVNYIVARYGNFVLLNPPMQWNTAVLWIGPALLLAAAALGLARYLRNRGVAAREPSRQFSAAEHERLNAMLGEGKSP
jgi:cytochrome c-type biogenesis protein CcmH